MAKKKELDTKNEFILDDWLKSLEKFKLPKIDELPSIDLYMDQVLTYISTTLKPLIEDDNDLTASMINNYVKGKVIKAPNAKKYDRINLAQLIFISSVKQVLTIAQIKELLDNDLINHYDQLIDCESEMLNKTINEISAFMSQSEDNNDKLMLYKVAVKLAIEAEIKKIVVSKIMESLR